MKELTTKLSVLKVKIYNVDGLTIYSSEPSQMGADKSKNQGFLSAALRGTPTSKLSNRDSFSAFSGIVYDRNLVETYIPILGIEGQIDGVFELYTDVTPLVAQIETKSILVFGGFLFSFGVLYAILFLIIRRADLILKKQYIDLHNNEERITAKNIELEFEVVERVRAEEELRESRDEARAADRAKSEFLAAMSHELRTPLNAVIGFSEIIKTEALGPVGSTKYRDYAEDINESGQHLLKLINDILDLSKVESGADELHEENIEVSETANATLKLVGHRAEQGGVKLELEFADQLPALRADERKLKQILVNLLSNAVKFTDAGGEVTLKAWCRKDSGYVFQITDTGIGIAPEDIPKALSRFGQVDADLNRKYEGTGLGLPLTKALVELHGGSLDLQSQVGVGTTATVRFPATRIVFSPRDTNAVGIGDRKAG